MCDAAGTTLARALRMTIYMTDLAAFAEVNEVYGSFFAEDPPARVAVGVAELPRGALRRDRRDRRGRLSGSRRRSTPGPR